MLGFLLSTQNTRLAIALLTPRRTTLKVVEIIMAKTAYGWSPEEIYFQHPYLTMSQIYAALAYYWEHKAELDNDIEQRENYAETMQKNTPETPFVKRLK